MINTSNILNALKRYDFTFFGITAAIFLIGVVNLYSATNASPTMSDLYINQIFKYLLAMGFGVAISFIQPKNFYRFSYFFYGLNLLLLVLVLIMGHKGMGAQRWIVLGPVRLQPSETTKIAVILVLARWYAKVHPESDLGLRELIVPFLLALVPTLLIVAEPDLGTGLLVLLIFFMISFYRKLKWKTIAIIAVLGIISGGLMYKFGLKPYQRKRVVTFLNPGSDAKGSGYNAI